MDNNSIIFDKEKAEKEVKEMLNKAIKAEVCRFYAMKVILIKLAWALSFALIFGLPSFFLISAATSVLKSKYQPWQMALTIGIVAVVLTLLLNSTNIYDKIKAHREWKKGKRDSSLDDLLYCCRNLYSVFYEYAWDDAYHNFCSLCELIENNILDATLKDNTITFELEGEDHIVFEWDVKIDKLIRSTAVEKDTLSWENGKIVYTKKYEGEKEK